MSLLVEEKFCTISPKGDLLAWCSSDGVIKFFDCLTGAIKHEYSSSSNLKGTCSCIQWPSSSNSLNNSGKSNKKLKTNMASTINNTNELKDMNLIAIGSSEGSILIYDLTKASLFSLLQHNSQATRVNDVYFNLNQHIYACSDDGSILEWNFSESKLVSKWKASKIALTAIIVDSKSKYLLTASRSIAIWDLSSKTKLKTLSGHSTDVFKLIQLNKNLVNRNEDFFISAALNDRVINAWIVSPQKDHENSSSPIASFSLSDSPIYIDIINLNLKNRNETIAVLIVVTNRGNLCLYLNELPILRNETPEKSSKNPLGLSSAKPFKQLVIDTKENTNNNNLKIYAACLCNSKNERTESIDLDVISASDSDLNAAVFKNLAENYGLFIVYGSNINLRMEKLNLDQLTENKTRLMRDDPSKISISTQIEHSKIENFVISRDLQVLVPGVVGPQIAVSAINHKRKSNETKQMTLEEKLDVMGINNLEGTNGDTFLKGSHLPKADNLLVLLVQGLQSNDLKTLNHVLQHQNEKVIEKTISLLPSQYVMSLVKELTLRLQGHAQSGLGMIKWLKSILMIHTSYLMSYPDLIDTLCKIFESMNTRTKLFPQLSKLQGKLQLAISQISSQTERFQLDVVGEEKDRQELLYYQESTSEDEQIEDDLIPSHCEELEADEFLFSDEEDESIQDETGINT